MHHFTSFVRQYASGVFAGWLLTVALTASAQAQVSPRVCVDTTYQTGTVTLASAAAADAHTITVNGYVPPLVSLVINPGGATEERFSYVNVRIDGNNPYTLGFTTSLHSALNPSSFNSTFLPGLAHAHSAGETVRFEGYAGKAYFGYTNLSASTVSIPRGITTLNFFTPGPTSHSGQPNQFQPGTHDNVFSVPFGGQATDTLTWVLSSGVATLRNGQGQGCAAITYQGRLTDAGSAANGQYDLRLTVFDALTGGTAQSGAVVIENAPVTNGIFTVQPNFGSSFTNNDKARFIEIAVRPGNAANTDPFTALAPRQPITSVPFALNAQFAANATNATSAAQLNGVAANQYVLTTDPRLSANNNTNFIQNTTTQQANSNFNISGNGTIGGNLNLNGTIANGCRAGFTAIAGGRLCVSALQPTATFLSAVQSCRGMHARVGNYADALLTLSQNGFNYFEGATQGWLADYVTDNVRGTWITPGVQADFDGPPLNTYNGNNGSEPTLPYRCVY
jgi:hypothetical protein